MLRRLSVGSALMGAFPVVGSDQALRAVIKHVVAITSDSGDPGLAAYKVKFDFLLSNGSAQPIAIPKPGKAIQVAVLGVQTAQSDGTWKNLAQSSWYDVGTEKYEPCGSLSPGGATLIGDVESGFVLLRRQLADLGSEPTLRFNMMIFCRQPDGTVLSKGVTTEAFSLRLSAQP